MRSALHGKRPPICLGSFSRVERYARLWTNVVEYELRRTERGTLFILHRTGPRRLGMRLSNEATLASAVSLARQVSPVPFAPMEATVQHPAPKSLDAHQAYFGCPLRFDCAYDALLLSDEVLLQPNILGDRGITQFIVSHLDAEMAEIDDDAHLIRQTKDSIARALSEGLPKMADVAKGLGLSVRSFHRRLAEHGASFQTLTDQTRRELALGMLQDERLFPVRDRLSHWVFRTKCLLPCLQTVDGTDTGKLPQGQLCYLIWPHRSKRWHCGSIRQAALHRKPWS